MSKRMGPAAIFGAVALILCGAPAMALSQDGAALRAAKALIRRKKFDEAEAKIASILKLDPDQWPEVEWNDAQRKELKRLAEKRLQAAE